MALFGGKKGKKSKVVMEIEGILSDGDDYLKQGNTEKAASEYRRAHRYLYREEKVIEQPEDFSELYTRAGHGLFETGEPDRAIECFDKATQLMPDNVDAWLSRGMVHLSSKTMLNYAIMCFSEVLKRYPNSVEALENKAEALMLDDKMDEAKEVYQKLIEVNPSNKDEYIAKAGGELPAAPSPMDEVNELLKAEPDNVDAWRTKAELWIAEGNTEKAVECYLRLGHLTNDISHYEKSLELDPDNESAKAKVEELRGAEPAVEEPVVEETPAEPTAEPEPEMPISEEPTIEMVAEPEPTSIGEEPIEDEPLVEETAIGEEPIEETAMGEDPIEETPAYEPEPIVEESIAEPEPIPEPMAEEPAIELVSEPVVEEELTPEPEPKMEEPTPESIDIPVDEPQVTEEPTEDEPEPVMEEEAPSEPIDIPMEEPVADTSMGEEPTGEPAGELSLEELAERGDELFGEEKYEDALECFQKIVNQVSNDQDALHNMAAVLYKLERFDEATQTFDKLIEIEPNDVTAYLTKGAALYWSGKYDEAIDSLNNVVKRDSNDGAAWYYKACAEAKKGNNQLVIPFLKRAMDIEPDFKERAREDDAFEAVRDDEEFKGIVG